MIGRRPPGSGGKQVRIQCSHCARRIEGSPGLFRLVKRPGSLWWVLTVRCPNCGGQVVLTLPSGRFLVFRGAGVPQILLGDDSEIADKVRQLRDNGLAYIEDAQNWLAIAAPRLDPPDAMVAALPQDFINAVLNHEKWRPL